MYYISIRVNTNLTDKYFDEDEDSDRFNEWFEQVLTKHHIFDFVVPFNPDNIEDVSTLTVTVDEFDYRHCLYFRVSVDDGSHDFDWLADNAKLLNYVETQVAPEVIDLLNSMVSDITVPMTDGTNFSYLKFDTEFYAMISYSENYGYRPYADIINTPFVLEYDFEVFV